MAQKPVTKVKGSPNFDKMKLIMKVSTVITLGDKATSFIGHVSSVSDVLLIPLFPVLAIELKFPQNYVTENVHYSLEVQ